jgi:hypothetical protein
VFRLKNSEELLCGPGSACRYILFSLADPFGLIRESGKVEQPLIRLYVLEDGLRLAVDSQHDRAAALSQLPHHLDRVIAEGCERLGIVTQLDSGVPLRVSFGILHTTLRDRLTRRRALLELPQKKPRHGGEGFA